jgi:TolB-like protein/Tfp pilus assembly protein PilF
VRFGEFEVDMAARELRRSGARVPLQDQPFELLTILLERPGEVVHREVIQRRLWPDGTFVDFEHSVNAAIRRLRTALGDSADAPRFVLTVHRRGYKFGAVVEASHPGPPDARQADTRPRLVVLPFTSVPPLPDDYFADGLTEELIVQLGRRCGHHVGVLARTSSLLYRRLLFDGVRDEHERRVADYHVEGSVRRDGGRVRVTARLVNTHDDTQVWARSYDGQVADCLTLQAEVASEIAHALALELLPASALGPVASAHPDAYQAFLRGRYHWNKAAEAGLKEAITAYDEAIALDPAFGRAYSSRARARVALCECYLAPPTEALCDAFADATRALDFDPGDAEALLVRGEVNRVLRWDWQAAEEDYRAAVASNPNGCPAHRYYALFLATQRRSEAVALAQRACDLDPLCLTVNSSAGLVAYYRGDYATAARRYQMVLDMDRTFAPARRGLAATLLQLGRAENAVAQLRSMLTLRLDPASRAWLGYALAAAGAMAEARSLAAQLDARNGGRPFPAYPLALLYAGLCESDRAFEQLDRACDARDPALGALAVEPAFAALREDPRYRSLAIRIGLSGLSVDSD